MAEIILSPDGTMSWVRGEWVPYVPEMEANIIQDSVVMGDVRTEVTHKHQHNHSTSIHNTVTQDSEKMIRSHISTMVDALSEGRLADAKTIFERAKQIDYDLANELHNGEYYPFLVNALFRDAENYCNSMVLNYRFHKKNETIHSYSLNFNSFCAIGINKIQTVLQWNPKHIPTLILNAELIRVSTLSNRQKNIQSEKIYNSILLIEPNHQLARYSLNRIIKIRKIKNSMISGGILFVLILLIL